MTAADGYTTNVDTRLQTEAAAVADLAFTAAGTETLDPEQIQGAIVPAGARHEVIDLERLLPNPRRKIGTIVLHDAESFAAYVIKHRIADATTMYADVTTQGIVGVIDDASADVAGWRQHVAKLTLKRTVAWERWIAKDNKLQGQEEFAEHIEQSLPDIVDPEAATMLELAQTFQANTAVTFRSSKLLHNGQQQLQYVEDTQATAGANGEITVPREFILGISPFEIGEPYKVTARLRFRIDGGHLRIGYKLDRPEDILREAFADVVKDVQTRTTEDVLYGTPPQG